MMYTCRLCAGGVRALGRDRSIAVRYWSSCFPDDYIIEVSNLSRFAGFLSTRPVHVSATTSQGGSRPVVERHDVACTLMAAAGGGGRLDPALMCKKAASGFDNALLATAGSLLVGWRLAPFSCLPGTAWYCRRLHALRASARLLTSLPFYGFMRAHGATRPHSYRKSHTSSIFSGHERSLTSRPQPLFGRGAEVL
jgi:hypothetical protein